MLSELPAGALVIAFLAVPLALVLIGRVAVLHPRVVALTILYASIATYPVTRYFLPFGVAEILVPGLVIATIPAWPQLADPRMARWTLSASAILVALAATLTWNTASSALFSGSAAGAESLRVLQAVATGAVVFALMPGRRALRLHAQLVLGFACVMAVDAWIQHYLTPQEAVATHPWSLFGSSVPAWVTSENFRVFATTGNPITLGAWMQLPVAYSLAATMLSRSLVMRSLGLAGGLAFGSVIWLTQSRSALTGAVVVVAITIVWAALRSDRGRARSLLVLGVVTILSGLILAQALAERPESAAARELQWQSAFDSVVEHPVFGVGPRQYPIVYSYLYIRPDAPRDPSVYTTENVFLQQLAEYGGVGLLALLAVYAAAARSGLDIARRSGDDADLARATLLGLAGWLVTSQFAVVSAAESTLLVWATFGALARAYVFARRDSYPGHDTSPQAWVTPR